MPSVAVGLVLGLFAFTSTPRIVWATSEHQDGVTDVYQIFEKMPEIYVMYDMDDDGDLDCSKIVRTEINEAEQSAVYIWQLTVPEGQPSVRFNAKARPGSDEADLTLGEEHESPGTATYLYSDYNTCVIAALPLLGRPECVMGSANGIKTNVSQTCIDAFEENCHTKVRGFDKETCI
ncbi:uncharacterized protein LOC144167335 [Haemaphysalis longicornis]